MKYFKLTLKDTERNSKQLIGDITKCIFGYDIIQRGHIKDMDDRCSYITVTFDRPKTYQTDILILYSPLYDSTKQEQNFDKLIREIKKEIPYDDRKKIYR